MIGQAEFQGEFQVQPRVAPLPTTAPDCITWDEFLAATAACPAEVVRGVGQSALDFRFAGADPCAVKLLPMCAGQQQHLEQEFFRCTALIQSGGVEAACADPVCFQFNPEGCRAQTDNGGAAAPTERASMMTYGLIALAVAGLGYLAYRGMRS